MIKAIFYSKFDVHEGPKVIHQVPKNSITTPPDSPSTTKPLIHFPSISPFIIPRQTFCSHSLTLLSSSYRILSHPICLASPDYLRNEFIFSFSIVLHHRTPFNPYASVCTKLATLFQNLEETSRFLSQDASAPDTGKVFALCEILLEDLNNYSEAMIPIDDANTLNIKLFPSYAPPPPLSPHQVPLAIVNLDALKDESWDLTMLRILPYIDGVNSLKKIAWRADADYKLVRKAVAHLVYYGCVMLTDVWSFGACYAPTEAIGQIVSDADMQGEGRRYVLTPEARAAISAVATAKDTDASTSGPSAGGTAGIAAAERVEKVREYLEGSGLVELYLSLRQGQSLRNWCLEHADILASGVLDVRRFIHFGIVKGFLYRVHKYAIATRSKSVSRVSDDDRKGAATSSELGEGIRKAKQDLRENRELAKYLDGMHCFDEICTELEISEKELLARLRNWGDVQIFYK